MSLLLSLSVIPWIGVGAQAVDHQARAARAERGEKGTTPSLSLYTSDLTKLARQGKLEAIGGYETQIERTVRVLAQSTKNNPVLLSEPGVARNLVVEGVAQRIARGDVPASLVNKRVLRLNLDSMLARVHNGNEFKSRLESVLSEMKDTRQGQPILFIDGLDSLIGANEARSSSPVSALETALANNELRIIGASTQDYFKVNLISRESLKGQLEGINIDDVSGEATDEGELDKDTEKSYEALVGNKISPDLREGLQNSGASASRISLMLQGEELKNLRPREFLIGQDVMIGDNVSSNSSTLFYGDNTSSIAFVADHGVRFFNYRGEGRTPGFNQQPL
jgi:hypothetical protein